MHILIILNNDDCKVVSRTIINKNHSVINLKTNLCKPKSVYYYEVLKKRLL